MQWETEQSGIATPNIAVPKGEGGGVFDAVPDPNTCGVSKGLERVGGGGRGGGGWERVGGGWERVGRGQERLGEGWRRVGEGWERGTQAYDEHMGWNTSGCGLPPPQPFPQHPECWLAAQPLTCSGPWQNGCSPSAYAVGLWERRWVGVRSCQKLPRPPLRSELKRKGGM